MAGTFTALTLLSPSFFKENCSSSALPSPSLSMQMQMQIPVRSPIRHRPFPIQPYLLGNNISARNSISYFHLQISSKGLNTTTRNRIRNEEHGVDNHQQQQVRRAYPFHEIEPRWQRYWEENRTFRTPDEIDTSKPKFYILDMFPYPRSVPIPPKSVISFKTPSELGLLSFLSTYSSFCELGFFFFLINTAFFVGAPIRLMGSKMQMRLSGR